MDQKKITISDIQELPTDTIGHDILRYIGLKELFIDDSDPLTYYLGKRLARRFKFESIEDIALLFHMMNWGHLNLIKEKKNELHFHLMSDHLAQKLESKFPIDFRLESGFLSEAISLLTGRVTECTEEINQRLYRAELKILFIE